MSDYIDQLARMMAAARPPAAQVGRGGPAIVPGGGGFSGGGMTTNNVNMVNSDIKASADVGKIAELFGFEAKTPSLYREIGAAGHKLYESQSPEQREMYLNDPKTQELLAKSQKAGYPGIIKDPSTGRLTYAGSVNDYIPAEQRGQVSQFGKPTEHGLAAGLYGPKARASYDLYRPKHEAELLGADALRRNAESQRTLQASQAKRFDAESNLAPGLARAKINEQNATAEAHRADASLAPMKKKLGEAQAAYYGRMPAERTEKEDPEMRGIREHMKQLETGWLNTQKAHEAVIQDPLKGGTQASRRISINTLGSSAIGHVQQTMALTGDPIRGIGPASYYLSQVANDMADEPQTEGGWVRSKVMSPQEDLHNRKVLNTTEALLSAFGNEVPHYIAQQSLRNVETLSQRINPTPEGIKQLATLLLFYDAKQLKAPVTAQVVARALPNLALTPSQKDKLNQVLRNQGIGAR